MHGPMRGELQGLGPFRLAGVLGEGERAVVYDAEREGTVGPRGALKVLRPALASEEEERDAFMSRARAGAMLAHPRIVALRDYGVIESTPWALLERVDGLALADLFPKRGRPRFSEPAARAILAGVLEALAAAAAAHPPLVHGRLDPTNVLIDADGDVRVAGFGTEGDPRTDLLDVARLALGLSQEWSPELDSWLDQLQDGDDRFAGPAEALAALPEVAAEEDGPAALARAVRRARKKRDQDPLAAPAPEPSAPAGADAAPEPRRSGPPAGTITGGPRRTPARRERDEALEGAVRQARAVGFIAAAALFAALLVEIFNFAG